MGKYFSEKIENDMVVVMVLNQLYPGVGVTITEDGDAYIGLRKMPKTEVDKLRAMIAENESKRKQ